jgi:hypothetical protein
MLGNHQLLERQLRKHGKSANATVLSCHGTLSMNQSVQGGIPVAKFLCTVDLRVEPDGAPAFETTTDAWFVGSRPSESTVVPVLYDPSDHSKLVVDHSDAAQIDAAIGTATARRVGAGGDPADASALGDMMRAATSDRDGFKKLMREQGPAAFGLKGHMQGSPAGGAAPASEDPLDRLSKLADLHDRGALTDAEFETEKKKLLGT